MAENNELSKLQEALSVFRAQVKQPALDAKNTFYKESAGYVTLAGVQQAVDEGIKGTGLAYVQLVNSDDNGNVYVETIITHKLGGILRSGKLNIPPKKRDAQGLGSSITYSRRYQLAAMFGITSDKDDDANAAVGGNPNQGRKQAPKKMAPKVDPNLKKRYMDLLNSLGKAYPDTSNNKLEASVKNHAFSNPSYQLATNADYGKAINVIQEQLRKSGAVEETTLNGFN